MATKLQVDPSATRNAVSFDFHVAAMRDGFGKGNLRLQK